MSEERNNLTKKEMTVDELAKIVQAGFLSVEDRLGKVESEVRGIKSDIAGVKSDTEDIKAELNKKVDIFTHNDLKYRVEKLEEKFA